MDAMHIIKYLSLVSILLFSVSANAETIETKYFSLKLPDSLTHVEGNENKEKASAKIFAATGSGYPPKTFLIIEYKNKEDKSKSQNSFEEKMKDINANSDEDSSKNFFKGVKLIPQACGDDCQAYYREVSLTDTDGNVINGYQFFAKTVNYEIFLAYMDSKDTFKAGRDLVMGLIKQISN